MATTVVKKFTSGQRVLARWNQNGLFYFATVVSAGAKRSTISFLDGSLLNVSVIIYLSKHNQLNMLD